MGPIDEAQTLQCLRSTEQSCWSTAVESCWPMILDQFCAVIKGLYHWLAVTLSFSEQNSALQQPEQAQHQSCTYEMPALPMLMLLSLRI